MLLLPSSSGWHAYASSESTGRRNAPGVHPALIPTGRIDSAIADVHLFLDDLETATSPMNKDYYMASKGAAQHQQFFCASNNHPPGGIGTYPHGSYPPGSYPPGSFPPGMHQQLSPGSKLGPLGATATVALAKQTSKGLSNQLTAAGYPSATSSAAATVVSGTSYTRLPSIGAFRAGSGASCQGLGPIHCHSLGSANSCGMSPLAEELGNGVYDAASGGSIASGSYPLHARSPSRAQTEALQQHQLQQLQQQRAASPMPQAQQTQQAQSPAAAAQQQEPQATSPSPQRQASSVAQALAAASFKSASSRVASPQASPRTTKEYSDAEGAS